MPDSDLLIVKNVNNPTPNVGSNITFHIDVFNLGPDDDTGVVVTDMIPSGFSIVSATPSTGTWLSPNWTIGGFLAGNSASIDIVVAVLSSGNYVNTSTITGDNNDPNPENNTSTATAIPIPKGKCQTQVIVTVESNFNWAAGTTIQYFIGATAITGLVNVGGATSIGDVQSAINADATYLASGTTITVLFFDVATLTLHTLIQKSSHKQIAVSGSVTWTHGGFSASGTGAFTCNLNPVKPKSSGGGVGAFAFPDTLCVARSRDGMGNLMECEQEVFYPSKYGKKYVLYYQNDTQCCYKLK